MSTTPKRRMIIHWGRLSPLKWPLKPPLKPPLKRRWLRPRFSLRTLAILVTLAAIGLGVVTSKPAKHAMLRQSLRDLSAGLQTGNVKFNDPHRVEIVGSRDKPGMEAILEVIAERGAGGGVEAVQLLRCDYAAVKEAADSLAVAGFDVEHLHDYSPPATRQAASIVRMEKAIAKKKRELNAWRRKWHEKIGLGTRGAIVAKKAKAEKLKADRNREVEAIQAETAVLEKQYEAIRAAFVALVDCTQADLDKYTADTDALLDQMDANVERIDEADRKLADALEDLQRIIPSSARW